MKKYRNIILALSVVLLLNSCLVSTAVGTVAGAAVEVVKLPFKLIGGIINIINGSNRDKEIEKVGMSKYEKKVSEILERKKETLTFGNFSVYSYKDLEFLLSSFILLYACIKNNGKLIISNFLCCEF